MESVKDLAFFGEGFPIVTQAHELGPTYTHEVGMCSTSELIAVTYEVVLLTTVTFDLLAHALTTQGQAEI